MKTVLLLVAFLGVAWPGYAATNQELVDELYQKVCDKENGGAEKFQEVLKGFYEMGYEKGYQAALNDTQKASQPNLAQSLGKAMHTLGGRDRERYAYKDRLGQTTGYIERE